MSAYCGTCKFFKTDIMCGDKPMEHLGKCVSPDKHRDFIESDDFCHSYKEANWYKQKKKLEGKKK